MNWSTASLPESINDAAGPRQMMRPCSSIAASSPMRCALAMSWVMAIAVLPNRRTQSTISPSITAPMIGSRPVVGSSKNMMSGCEAIARWLTDHCYRMTGKREDDTWGCIAWAEDKKGERLESPEITISIAKAEGWYQKNGSKWKTMPELMLRYRCATLFARLYAPELTMGIQTADEVEDIAPVVSEPVRPIFGAPKEERKYDPEMDRVQAPAQAAEPAKPEVKPDPQSDTARMVKAVKQLLKMRNVSEIDLMALLHTEGLDDSIGTVDELAKVAVKTLEKVHEKWADYESKIKGAAK